ADVTNDGNLDMLGSDFLLINNGAGVFNPGYSYGFNSGQLAILDFNNDGWQDVVSPEGYCKIYFNQGGGVFYHTMFAADPSNYASVTDLISDDFNGDGRVDIASATNGGINIILSVVDTIFKAHIGKAVISQPNALTSSDFDNDGDKDIALCNYSNTNNVEVIYNNGAGNFSIASSLTLTTGVYAVSIATGDFNADNKIDLAVLNTTNVSIFLNNGSGGFGTATNFNTFTSPTSIKAADFNKDEKLNLAVAGSSLSIHLNNGTGTFGSPVNYNYSGAYSSLTVADLNNDSFPDVSCTAESANITDVFFNNAT